MPEYENNHYVQNKLLKNFAVKASNGKYKIQIIDLQKRSVEEHNTDSAFYEKNLYDVKGEDVKKLEKDLNEKIEKPFNIILDRLVEEPYDTFTMVRSELETIKKYLLIQIYRNYRNSISYSNTINSNRKMSRFNIEESETELDFWCREMQTILDNSFDDLLGKCDLVGVKQNAHELHSGFLMFFNSSDEFVINDLGSVTERIPVNITMPPEEYAKSNEELGRKLFGGEGYGEIAKERAELKSEYIDNYIIFPVANDMAIVVVSSIWKQIHINKLNPNDLGLMYSPILSKYLSIPENKFMNQKLIKKPADILKYKSKNDKYIYRIHDIGTAETIYINNLLLNEAFRYVGYKTKENIMPSILEYTLKQYRQQENVKNDFSFVVDKK